MTTAILKMVFSKGGLLILALLLATGGGAILGWKARAGEVAAAKADTKEAENALHAAETASEARQMAIERRWQENMAATEQNFKARLEELTRRKEEVRRDIPSYIPAEVDHSFPLSRGFVCVCDAAAAPPVATGSSTARPACESPGEPSPITESDTACWVVEVCAQYYTVAEQLKQLQKLYKEQQRAVNGSD